LGQGRVHVAGVHLGSSEANAAAVSEGLGSGYRLLGVACWEEGLCLAPTSGVSSIRAAVNPGVRWVGREEGSAARQCLDELLGGRRKAPRRLAADHRGVAEAVRQGWADVGVCLRLSAEEFGLNFLAVRRESYELCFPQTMEADPRIQALMAAVRSPGYRRAWEGLPGYMPWEDGL
jgi:molybdate-binding protein